MAGAAVYVLAFDNSVTANGFSDGDGGFSFVGLDPGEIRIAAEREDRLTYDGGRMPGASWFAGAELNFARNLLRFDDDREARADAVVAPDVVAPRAEHADGGPALPVLGPLHGERAAAAGRSRP